MFLDKEKIYFWIKRYVAPELVGIPLALVSAFISKEITRSDVAAAIAGTWGENLGYYGYIFINDLKKNPNKASPKRKYGLSSSLLKLFNIVLEFGPAEIADTLFNRPILMYFSQIWLSSTTGGILLGKFLADSVFIVVILLTLEIRKILKLKAFS